MARVLVTGGAGFIGSHLVDALVAKKHTVTVVDDLSSGKKKNLPKDVKFIKLDIRSPKLRQVFQTTKPQYVFHLAAQKNVRTSVENPKFDADVNIQGSLNVIELARKYKVKKFIFSSTGGALYGDGVPLPTPETIAPRPESPYGIAKYTVEQYLRFYQKVYGLQSVSLRYANVYGPRQDPKGEAGVVAIFARQILKKKPLYINGTGKQTRDYVYVSDVVRANLVAMRSKSDDPMNIGTGKETSVNLLISSITKISGRLPRIERRQALVGELLRNALRADQAKRILGWKTRVPLPQGLHTTLQSFGVAHE